MSFVAKLNCANLLLYFGVMLALKSWEMCNFSSASQLQNIQMFQQLNNIKKTEQQRQKVCSGHCTLMCTETEREWSSECMDNPSLLCFCKVYPVRVKLGVVLSPLLLPTAIVSTCSNQSLTVNLCFLNSGSDVHHTEAKAGGRQPETFHFSFFTENGL